MTSALDRWILPFVKSKAVATIATSATLQTEGQTIETDDFKIANVAEVAGLENSRTLSSPQDYDEEQAIRSMESVA